MLECWKEEKKETLQEEKRVVEPCTTKESQQKTIHDSHCTIAFLEEMKKPAIMARQG
jgi:hypothetical protein